LGAGRADHNDVTDPTARASIGDALAIRLVAAKARHRDCPMHMIVPAKVFEAREHAGEWRVEWFDEDGGCEVAIFSGPNARERALRYADRQYGGFEEVVLEPYP
jgi:hypothetical protein